MSKLAGVGHLEDIDIDRNGVMKTATFGAGKKPVLIMVYGNYCGYCMKAAPAFKNVHDQHKQKKVFLCALQTDDPAVSDLMKRFPSILKKAGIPYNGVPMYIVYKNGEYSEFTGGRSEADLWRFIESQ